MTKEEKEELELIKLWFDTIRESAKSRRNANGVLVSPSHISYGKRCERIY